jgi:CRISPR-associated protein Cas1|nr:MAG: hypothetical protein TU36_05215 [Vulcanisaeta sp. AZ3]
MGMSLVLSNDSFKIYVRKGVVRVRSGRGEVVVDSSIERIIVATHRALITAKAIRQLITMGIDVVFLAPNGEPIARVYPPIINKTVASRRAQFEAVLNGKGLVVARVIVKSKIMNQANLLRYIAKSKRIEWIKDEAIKLDEITTHIDKAGNPTSLMELEAQAARHYWQSLAQLVGGDFTGRRQEGTDEFNIMLNYGYGILRYTVEKLLLIHGLDPYAGFLHVDRSGKPSLTLDVMEPFRPVVDRAFLFSRPRVSVVNGYLDYESRGLVIKVVNEALNSKVYFNGKATPVINAIRSFIEDLVSYLRDGHELAPPVIRW